MKAIKSLPGAALGLPVVVAGLFASGSLVHAQTVSGQVVLHDPPPALSLESEGWTNDLEIQLWREQSGVTLAAALPVNLIEPASVGPQALVPGVVEAGTVVSSYMLHADQVGTLGFRTLWGSVTFDGEQIIGVITDDAELASSDILQHPNPTYPTAATSFRGINTANGDWIRWSGNTLEVYLTVYSSIDQIRVLTGRRLITSLDMGSDTEYGDPAMDGNEVHDPGDMYLSGAGLTVYFDDAAVMPIFFPEAPAPLPVAPVCAGGIFLQYFDLDGFDQVNLPGFTVPGPMPRAQFQEDQRAGIYEPGSLVISFDDDDRRSWCRGLAGGARLPVEGPSPSGATYGAAGDELWRVSAPFGAPTLVPEVDEQGLDPDLAPNPVGGEQHDDDVDALDWLARECSLSLFSLDHEGRGGGGDPATIYYDAGGMPAVFIDRTLMGLAGGTDVDAFELIWGNEPQLGGLVLCVLFSVDQDDLGTAGDESGGLLPSVIYCSPLDGTHAPFTPSLGDDVDAIAAVPEIASEYAGGGLENSCQPAATHSGQDWASIAFRGSLVVGDNDVRAEASHLPTNVFGYFLCARSAGFIANPGGSSGVLCMGSPMGRFIGPGQPGVQNSGATGEFGIPVDLTHLPLPSATIVSGETLHLQAWFRDGLTSNFTDSAVVTFL